MEKALEDKIRYHHLFDIYGVLLTGKQKQAFEYHYLDDYSLSEIASLLNVSRNAVYEQITIATNYLDEYESKLGLLAKSEKSTKIIEQLKALNNLNPEMEKLIQELEKLE